MDILSKENIFNLQDQDAFKTAALTMFKYQFEHNKVYRSFCDLLYIHPSEVRTLEHIPYLPIQFFKNRTVVSDDATPAITFTSSGTTGSTPSKHLVTDLTWYTQSFRRHFEQQYGNPSNYTILALLPSYLERSGSSLIYMVKDLIEKSGHPDSGFYLNDFDQLASKLTALDQSGQKVLLIGVSFALLDLVEKHTFSLQNTVVIETGGMKGRRTEMIRPELHTRLKEGFNLPKIHSEYGMTELLSQAYSVGEKFYPPRWMHIAVRDPEDPFTILPHHKTGGLNIIDLANKNSCAFIATQDLGRTYSNGGFTVLGRFDHADIRGCNLMAL